jgi:hypothetical protein
MSEFIQPFDGSQPEIPHEEKTRITKTFEEGIDNLFQKYFDDSTSKQEDDFFLERLELDFQENPKGPRYHFWVKRGTDFRTDTTERSIQIGIREEDSRSHMYNPLHLYKQPHTDPELVIRQDFIEEESTWRDYHNGDQDTNSWAEAEGRRRMDEFTFSEIQRDMGFNEQPIRHQEIQKIMELAQKAELSAVPVHMIELTHDANTEDSHIKLGTLGEREAGFEGAAGFFSDFIDDIITDKADSVKKYRRGSSIFEELPSTLHTKNQTVSINITREIQPDIIDRRVVISSQGLYEYNLIFEEIDGLLWSSKKSGDLTTFAVMDMSNAHELRNFLRKPAIEF